MQTTTAAKTVTSSREEIVAEEKKLTVSMLALEARNRRAHRFELDWRLERNRSK